jgi:hypothetical protein
MSAMQHTLKCWPAGFAALAEGTKTLELRPDDRGYAVGDTLLLREWDPTTTAYTERALTATVTHVLRDPDGRWLRPGVVALSLADVCRVPARDTTTVINLRDTAAVAAAKAAGPFVREDRHTRWGNPFTVGPGARRSAPFGGRPPTWATQPRPLKAIPDVRGKTGARPRRATPTSCA